MYAPRSPARRRNEDISLCLNVKDMIVRIGPESNEDD